MSADRINVRELHRAQPLPAESVRPSDYLSPSELHALTGSPQKRRQATWLRKNGWKFALDLYDRPRVARAYYDRRMVGIESDSAPPPASSGPNWGALGI